MSVLLLTACDNYPYKTDIQETYDWNNKSGSKAICMIVGDVSPSMYPYTIKYMEGENLPFSYETQRAHYNKKTNNNLHFFSKLDFFTEELVGEFRGKTLYRYDITDLGKQYFDGFRNYTNFCFGRVVVDSIDRTKDSVNNLGGGKERDVSITYHIENIPDWAKNPEIYKRYYFSEKVATGEALHGEHTYRILGKDKLETLTGISGRYKLSSTKDD